MRKNRSLYKVNGRLGYNAMLRRWVGRTKKWEKHVMSEQSETNQVNIVNPTRRWTNEDRRGKTAKGKGQGKKNVRRRKDGHGRVQSQKTGRKRRYGNVPRKSVGKDLEEERKSYKGKKSERERKYRKGERTRERRSRERNRRTGTETRVDVRRWRSGRVKTIQRARDLIEHNGVSYVEGEKEKRSVKWQGDHLEVGKGRQIQKERWKRRKEEVKKQVENPRYEVSGMKYREVDYVTGRMVLIRNPLSDEVRIPKGRNLSVSSVRKG